MMHVHVMIVLEGMVTIGTLHQTILCNLQNMFWVGYSAQMITVLNKIFNKTDNFWSDFARQIGVIFEHTANIFFLKRIAHTF